MRKTITSGAFHGAVAWTIYAVVECIFSSIIPWIIEPDYIYKPVHWGFTALLFGLYPNIGLILGGLSGLGFWILSRRISFLQGVQPDALFRAMGTFTVVLAFTINLIIQSKIGLSVLVILSVSLLLVCVLMLSAGSDTWLRRLGFIMNPWTPSMVLIGLSWITLELLKDHSKVIKAGAILSYLCTVFVISFFVQKMRNRQRTNKLTVPFSVLIVFGISLFARQTPFQRDAAMKSLSLEASRPNVILITMDTVRADHLSLYGYERDTTPNLKEFSENATLYTHAIAPGDMTLPTHASIFTGLYARQHGAHYDPWTGYPIGRPLADKFQTLSEILSDEGYLTMGVIANHAYITHKFGLDQGFSFYDERRPVVFLGNPLLEEIKGYYLRKIIRNGLAHLATPSVGDMLYRKADMINKEAFFLLDRVKKNNQRFFLFINYMDAHDPYTPPAPFNTLYPGKDEMFTSNDYRSLLREVIKFKRSVTDRKRNHLISQYDGGIVYIDFNIIKLIERLKALDLYENSLIIITSDHGETFGERNLLGHGVSVYQDQVYVPLIIKYPNVNKKIVVNKFVSPIDIMPTILDVLGYEVPEYVQGLSLTKLESWNARTVIAESFPKGPLLTLHPGFNRVERAIFFWPFKFILSTAGKRELYDLSKDPDEKNNLYRPDDETSRRLEMSLNHWLKTVSAETGSPAKLNKETLDHLKALGYVQ